MEEQELHFEDEFCTERTESQWIAYKFFTAQSSILSILGSSVSVISVLLKFICCLMLNDGPLNLL